MKIYVGDKGTGAVVPAISGRQMWIDVTPWHLESRENNYLEFVFTGNNGEALYFLIF